MKERPILFSGPLVRALIAGTKTQTRRPVKGIEFRGAGGKDGADWNDPSCWGWADEYGDEWALAAAPGVRAIPCPYGVPGDRLWVRETFQFETNDGFGDDYEPPFADGRPVQWEDRGDEGRVWCQPHYRATDPEPELCCNDERCSNGDPHGHWQPSIHMPRWASRLTLEITDVRVQRLQEISDEDIVAEGIEEAAGSFPLREERMTLPRHAFAHVWGRIYGKGSWDASPWVWALTFKVVKA